MMGFLLSCPRAYRAYRWQRADRRPIQAVRLLLRSSLWQVSSVARVGLRFGFWRLALACSPPLPPRGFWCWLLVPRASVAPLCSPALCPPGGATAPPWGPWRSFLVLLAWSFFGFPSPGWSWLVPAPLPPLSWGPFRWLLPKFATDKTSLATTCANNRAWALHKFCRNHIELCW